MEPDASFSLSTNRAKMVLRKDELEVQLKEEHDMIKQGKIRDDSPLDNSEEFQKLCEACRLGDLKTCQEMISLGININARDTFDYTPLILVGELSEVPPSALTDCSVGKPLRPL